MGFYGFGTGGYGTMGVGTSDSYTDALAGVVALAENRFRATFIAPIRAENIGLPGDAHDLTSYTVVGDPSSRDSLGQPPRPLIVCLIEVIDSQTLDIIVDRPMSSWPARYNVTVDGLYAEDGSQILGETKLVTAVLKGLTAPVFDFIVQNRDIANPQGGRP